MKGKDWYREQEIAEEYEPKRFSGPGGSYIDSTEKEAVKEILGDIKNKRVLEIAAGTGRFTEIVSKEAKKVTACDISKPMLSIAKQKYNGEKINNINYVKVDAENLPFEENEFEIVFAIRFMHLVNNPEKFLKEMKRVTKDKIIFDTFSFSSFRIFYNKMLPMGSRLYKEEEVRELANKLGLKIDKKLESFALPFGVYRYAPDFMIKPFTELNQKMLDNKIFQNLASVGYWRLKKTKTS